ncbi:MAG: HNH endonuclease signature motif containing protein [Planctomycetota bacterium]
MTRTAEPIDSTSLTQDELRRQVKRARCDEQRGEYRCCQYLLQIDVCRCYLTWGYASIREFADRELCLTPRQTCERLRVARALAGLPALRAALERGELCFSAVREITRVATRATEHDWLDAARGASARDIERLVGASVDGKVPERIGFGLPQNRMAITLHVSPSQYALFEAVRTQVEHETGARATLESAVLRALAAHWQSGPRRPRARVPRRAVPELVYVKCPDCERGAVNTEQGLLPVSAAALVEVERQACVRAVPASDAPAADAVPASTPATPAVPGEQRDAAAGDELRARILARDGHRCRVPGCGARRDLQAHHVRWRRHGGATHAGNLVAVCGVHHAIIHAGRLVVSGTAPHRLSFAVP